MGYKFHVTSYMIIMPANKISLENAKKNKLFYFVANVVIYRESDGRCLILRRDIKEKVHPGKFAVPGGKLEWQDLNVELPTKLNGDVLDFDTAIEDLLGRETLEECGVKIEKELFYVNSAAFVRPDEIPVVLVKFAAKYKSGEIDLSEGAFTEYAWVNAEEVKKYDCILGIQEEVARTIEIFKELKN